MKTAIWITVFFALGLVIGFFLAVYMLTQRYVDQHKDKP